TRRRRRRERDDADIGVVDDGVTDLRTAARDEVDRARWETGLGHQLDQERRAPRRVAGRLEDDGVAGDERRYDLPARDRHREVPGRDDSSHTDRLTDAHGPLVREL